MQSTEGLPVSSLTKRERDVLDLMAIGLTNKDIAERLGLGARTVETHAAHVLAKLGANTRTGTIAEARRRGLISWEAEDDKVYPHQLGRHPDWPVTAAENLSLTTFVGRALELEEIAALVRDHRLVTLTGSGGVGKTQTALRVANAQTGDVSVCIAGLAPLRDTSQVMSTIASALALQRLPNRPLLETVIAHLKNKSLLLVLDNCEHVLAEVAALSGALLTSCPRLRILASSREPLRVAGEFTFRLPSLELPASVELFIDRARAVDHRFEFTDANARDVAEICRRLDGIPLAIELAAARINTFSAGAIARKLNDRFSILVGSARSAVPRHQTMRAAIDWSYDLLSDEERQLFERLSVFAGGCVMGTAIAICFDDEPATDAAFELFGSLVDKSLLVADREGVETRYRFLESFRQYAREKLACRGERELLDQRHAMTYLSLAESLDRSWGYSPDTKWLAQASAELENWRAALDWALTKRADVLLGLRLAGALRMVWTNFAIPEGRHWVHAAKQLVSESTPIDVRVGLDYAEACDAQVYGEFSVVLTASRRALEAYEQLGDALGIARANNMIGRAVAYLGDPAKAEAFLQLALSQSRVLESRRLVGFILEGLAYVRSITGDFSGARSFLEEAVGIYAAIGADSAAVGAALNLASATLTAGHPDSALWIAKDALAKARALSDLHYVTRALHNASTYAVALDRYDEARVYALEALALACERELDVLFGWTLQHLAAIAALAPAPVERAGEDRARSGRLLGYLDARLRELDLPREQAEQTEFDRTRETLVDAIGLRELERLHAIGASMSPARALEDALAVANEQITPS